MRNKIAGLLLVIILCAGLVLPCHATTDLLIDGAKLLSTEERTSLESRLETLSQEHQIDIVIVTVDEIEIKNPQAFADDFFDCNGYGQGSGRDGILLLISMEDRDWCISTSGYCITAFTDAGLAYIEDQIVPDLSDGEYARAFHGFADLCDEFILQARNDAPCDTHNMPKEAFDLEFAVMLSLAIGLGMAVIVTAVLKGQLKSVRHQPAAAGYMKPGSLCITKSRDTYLYKNVSKRPKPQSSGSSGGGSRTHRSSSGRSHGGRSGKF